MTWGDAEFESTLRHQLHGLPAPAPSATGLGRIMARIRLGEEVRLESGPPRKPVTAWAVAAGFLAACLAGAVALPLLWTVREDHQVDPRSMGEEDFSFLGIAPLAAQAVRPASARIGIPDPSHLPVGRWLYAVRSADGQSAPEAGRVDTATITRTTLAGRPAVLVTYAWSSSTGGPMVDSSWATADSLFPLRRVFHTPAGSTLTTTFGEDSVVRIWHRPDGSVLDLRAAVEQPAEWHRGMTLVGMQEWALYPLLPLRHHWQGHFAAMALANTGQLVTLFFDYRVTGDTTVTVPAGTYDCWVVEDASGRLRSLWVDKQTGWVVKERLGDGGSAREKVLQSYEPGL